MKWLSIFLLVTVAASGQTTQSLTLRDCIERALAHNLDVKIERLNPQIQNWGVVFQQGAFDPALTGSAIYTDTTEPSDPERAIALGVDSTTSQEWDFRSGFTGRLPTGTTYDLTAFDNRSDSSLVSNVVHTGFTGVTLTQPILKNFWLDANTAQIRIARKGKQIAEEVFTQQVINTISDTQNAYYNLVFAIEDHKAKLEDLHRAQALLADNRKRVEVGVLSRLDVTQAEAGVAEREEAVILAERAIKDAENALKRLISQDVSEFRHVALVPTDQPPVVMQELDAASSINTALVMRPDYRQQQHAVERQGIFVKYNHNQLWPEVDVIGSYGYNGRGGGFDSFADNVGSGENPVWSVGVAVTLPLGNRQARANLHQARLQQEQALLALKRLEQQILVDVDNAVGQVETNLKRVDATRAATRLAEESRQAEEEKLRAGSSTSFLVLQAQAQLAAARSAELRARADYNKSLVELARAEGTTLEKNAIRLDGDQ